MRWKDRAYDIKSNQIRSLRSAGKRRSYIRRTRIDRGLRPPGSSHARSGYAIWAPLSPRYAGIYAFDVFKGATLSLACRPRALLSPTKHPIPLSRREQCRAAVTCSTFDHYSRSVHKIGKLRRNRAARCAKFLPLASRAVYRVGCCCSQLVSSRWSRLGDKDRIN